MNFYLLVVLIVVGLLTNYFVMINYLKNLRSGGKNMNYYEIIGSSVFFGGPILLIFMIFFDVRLEDNSHHHALLISGIILTIIQIVLVTLLICLGAVKFN